jgi:hypothetical protein
MSRPLLSAFGLAAAAALVPTTASADFELDAALGYRFGGESDVEADGAEGRVSIDDDAAFTAIAGYQIQHDGMVYLSYTRQDSTLDYLSDDLEVREETRLTTDVIQFGGNLQVPRGRAVPYLGFSLGATRFAAVDLDYDDWAFSMALDGGVKLRITDWLHLRALGRLPLTFVTSESESFCVSGVGCVVRVSGGPVVQGEFYGGFGVGF